MVIDQLASGKDLNKILNLLRKRFGIDLQLHEATREEVEQILEHYENVKRDLMLSESFNTTFQHPEYAKAILICEACKLFLHEIAPARKNAKVRTKKQQKAEKTTEARFIHNCDLMEEMYNLQTEMHGSSKIKERVEDKDLQELIDENPKTSDSKFVVVITNASMSSHLTIFEVELAKIQEFHTDFATSRGSDVAYFNSYDKAKRFTVHLKLRFEGEYNVNITDRIKKKVREDFDPELDIGKDFEDAGASFDGEDHTNDYMDDRDPQDPHAYDFDYEEETAAVTTDQGIDPEIDPLDTEKSLNSMAKDDESGVVDRYEIEPKLSPDDYMDDRDPDTEGAPETNFDPMTDLRNADEADSPETLTGLDPSLETDMVDATPTMVGTGIKAPFNNDPSKSAQRDIPSPTDLQKNNNKHYNGTVREASLALAWINKINTRKYYNKIFEAADAIATERDDDIIHILNAVENHGRRYANSRNDEYTLGMVEALGMLGDVPQRQTIMEARSTNDKQRKLFNKLLNKSRSFNLSEGQSKRFVYAAHNALFNADLVKHNIL